MRIPYYPFMPEFRAAARAALDADMYALHRVRVLKTAVGVAMYELGGCSPTWQQRYERLANVIGYVGPFLDVRPEVRV